MWIIVSANLPKCIIDLILTCIRAGLFWASEGAVALGYPEPGKRGKYMK